MLTLAASTARDLMLPGSFALSDTATIGDAATFLGKHYGAAVVIDLAGHPLGVVTKTDVLDYQRNKSDRPHGPGHEPTTVRDIMTPATFTVAESLEVKAVIQQMVELNVHHLFVTDSTGIVIGMIEALDVLRRLM